MEIRQKPTIWQLAPESDPDERFIVVSGDGEKELTGIIARREDAERMAELLYLVEGMSSQDIERIGNLADFFAKNHFIVPALDVGDHVCVIDDNTTSSDVEIGDYGNIIGVDASDPELTYMVNFPQRQIQSWMGGEDLQIVTVEGDGNGTS